MTTFQINLIKNLGYIIISIVSLITTIIGLYYLGEKKAVGYIWFTISLACQMYLFYISKNVYKHFTFF